MKEFFEKSAMQNHPLRSLKSFLEQERANEAAKNYDNLRFVGYVLDIGYDTVTIITSDPYKIAVGGIPRNSLLIMVPSNYDKLPPHFTLLRVLEAAPTPLSKEVQQTYFELQKKSMPELDIFTQSELQWGALKTGVLGMFYPCPDDGKINEVEFSGDLNNFVSAHKYLVYAPNEELLNLITNSMVPKDNRFIIGDLRLTECRLPLPNKPQPHVPVYVSTKDFMGTRTAMFGKTRLGKSNVVKLIAQSLIETTPETKNVGQLILDINGEYANDNPQDDSSSLKSVYPERCEVYALTKKQNTESKPLRLDFYENPESSHKIIATLLKEAGKDTSIYISSFLSVDLPSIESLKELTPNEELRARRKILMYWAILHRAGYPANIGKLKGLMNIDPHINQKVRCLIHGVDSINECPAINSLDTLAHEFELAAEADRETKLKSSSGSGEDLFDADDRAILGFLRPVSLTSAGPKIVQGFRKYHDPNAGDFVEEIIKLLDEGKTVIIDLGNAPPEVTDYFSVHLSKAIFHNQVDKFSNNKLGDHYLQLYFEEAHNLFPSREQDEVDIYRRIAKEGAKYHMGMVYSTQSPTTVNKDLLAQTENFFVAHLSSQDEVNALAKVNTAYDSLKDDILQAKTVGYIRMLTRSNRFVISVQAKKFTPVKSKLGM
jgi:DNA helicase HerA-like ATPase